MELLLRRVWTTSKGRTRQRSSSRPSSGPCSPRQVTTRHRARGGPTGRNMQSARRSAARAGPSPGLRSSRERRRVAPGGQRRWGRSAAAASCALATRAGGCWGGQAPAGACDPAAVACCPCESKLNARLAPPGNGRMLCQWAFVPHVATTVVVPWQMLIRLVDFAGAQMSGA